MNYYDSDGDIIMINNEFSYESKIINLIFLYYNTNHSIIVKEFRKYCPIKYPKKEMIRMLIINQFPIYSDFID